MNVLVGRLLGAIAAALGLLALVGWALGREALTSLAVGSASLKVNTALCFVALGTAVVLKPTADRIVRQALASSAGVIAVATLVEYAWKPLDIDELLLDDPFTVAGTPGRMSLGTTIAVVAIAVGLLALESVRPIVRVAGHVPLYVACFVGLIGLVGYASGLAELYWHSDVGSMALETAAGIVFLGGGALVLAPREGLIASVLRPTPGGRLLRRLLPAAVLVPAAFVVPIGRGASAGWFGFDVGVLLFLLATIAVLLPLFFWAARSHDVSEAERERLLAESRAVLNAARDGILMTDVEGSVLLSNSAMDAFWRHTGLSDTGSIWDRVSALAELLTSPTEYYRLLQAVATDPEGEHVGEFTIAASGRSFLGRTAPVHTADGALMGRIFSLRETTTERASARAKDEFVATVSHELRTPLAAITGYAELLEDDVAELDGQSAEFLGVIQRNAERLTRLVDDLLFLQRSEADQMALERRDVCVDDLVRQSLERVGPAARRKSISVRRVGEDGLVVKGDEMRLGQILDNLLSNAVKFTPDGGVVSLRVGRSSSACTIEVEDTGPGIPEDERGRVFERFFRSRDAIARAVPGTGLGLVVSRRIAEAHGGALELVERNGSGTTFRLLLPFEADRAAVA